MRQCHDHVLGAIAKRLSGFRFSEPAEPSIELKARYSAGKLKNVYSVPNGAVPGWSVHFYCGAKSRYFAFFKYDWVSACRIADCIMLRIGARRCKTIRPVTPDEYNFGSSLQAELDSKNPVLAELLDRVEKHLDSIGALSSTQSPQALVTRVELLEKQVAVLVQAVQALTPKANA